jgi:hypothetical protein
LPHTPWQWFGVGLLACSGLPFVFMLPIRRTFRVLFGVISVPPLFIAVAFYGLWLGCSWFGGCP